MCKELRGWCRSFTKSEVALSTLQAALLILFIAFLTFLILHLMACSNFNNIQTTTRSPEQNTKTPTTKYSTSTSISTTVVQALDPEIECTWQPSIKSTAAMYYYENGQTSTVISNHATFSDGSGKVANDNNKLDNLADDKIADNMMKGFLLALVKMKLMKDVTFGCVLTIISKYSALTAASCIESIEEVDAVDSFVMLQHYGEKYVGRTHMVSDVLIHPEYQGTNKKFDIAVLKSEDSLIRNGQRTVVLPTMLDALLITIGEPLSMLGYGRFRRAEGEVSRVVHETRVRVLPGAHCSGAGATRHLSRGAGQRAAACAPQPLCAGAEGAGSLPCAYCAGTPLLRATLLLGTMAAAPCGDSCEPALYVNIATVRDWLQSILNDETK